MPCLLLKIKVIANAASNQLLGWQDPVFVVRIQAPLRDGRADERLCRFLAAYLEVPLSSVLVISGYGLSLKTVKILKADATRCLQRLGFPEGKDFASDHHSMAFQH
jgi:uncharacterized protein YggU (UPF0235/DUF167 family)